MSANEKEQPPMPAGEDGDDTARLRQGIERTRADMSATLGALESRLSPAELRGKVGEELEHVEVKIREVVREHLAEAKVLVKEELTEAKGLLREEMNEAESRIKKGLADARETVKKDLHEAVTGAKQSVRAATLGRVEELATELGDAMNETRDTLIDTIRQNPLPAALAGIGLAWLFMNRSTAASRRGRFDTADGRADGRGYAPGGYSGGHGEGSNGVGGIGRTLHGVQSTATSAVEHLGSAVGGAAHQVSDAASGIAHKASEAASEAAHQASDTVNHAIHGASELAGRVAGQAADAGTALIHGAGDAASFVAGEARSGMRRVEQGFHNTLHTNPLALGAAAIAVGAAVGFALPRTHREDELMGEARDRLLKQAGETAHDAVGAIGKLAEKTTETAKHALEGTSSSNRST